ncbi:MAG: hypothetical protein ABIJ16_04825, partial [Bacteroidota bacterium]
MKIRLTDNIAFLFFLTIICFGLALFIGNRDVHLPDDVINVEKFRKVLFSKEESGITKLENFIAQYDTACFSDIFLNEEGNKYFNDDGFSIFVYEDSILEFWSGNNLPVSNYYPDNNFSSGVLALKNAWVYVIEKNTAARTYIGLILIKHEYSYENDFIENCFQADFDIPTSVSISKLPASDGVAVIGNQGQFLFSLIPEYDMFTGRHISAAALILYILCIGLFLLMNYRIIRGLYNYKKTNLWLFVLLGDLLIVRFLMVYFSFPATLYELEIFSPQLYGFTQFLPSLGDFLINSLFLIYFAYVFYRVSIVKPISKTVNYLRFLSGVIIVVLLYTGIIAMTGNLIFNSSIPIAFNNFLEINVYSFVMLLVIGMLFASFIMIFSKIILLHSDYVPPLRQFAHILAVSAGVFLILAFTGITRDYYSYIFFILLTMTILYIIHRKFTLSSFASSAFLIALVALFVSAFITYNYSEKERKIRKVLVVNLSNERDLIGELQLEEFETKLREDHVLEGYLAEPYAYEDNINKHLIRNYFHGYWSKYDLQVTVCRPDGVLDIDNTGTIYNCFSYFDQIISREGLQIPNTNFYYLDNNNGRISYLGKISYFNPVDSININLYLDINSKLISTELGYPELLLENK